MERRHLTTSEMLRAVGMIEGGQSQSHVARELNTSRSVINRLWLRYQVTGDVKERHQGRGRKTTARQDRFLVLHTKRHRNITARQVVSVLQGTHGILVSDQTVRNRLHEASLFSRRPLRVPALRRNNRAARLTWAQDHVNWGHEEWANVMFSDESRFSFHPDGRRIRVWRQPGSAERLHHVQEVHSYRGGTVMVWAGVMMDRRTQLVFLEENMNHNVYLNSVLHPIVRPFANAHGEHFIFMQDNARAHVARAVSEWFRQEEISVLPWPAQSPDLNPIEHAWDQLQRAVTPQMENVENVGDFRFALNQAWDNLLQANIEHLILSMPRRCQAVLNARGAHTGY